MVSHKLTHPSPKMQVINSTAAVLMLKESDYKLDSEMFYQEKLNVCTGTVILTEWTLHQKNGQTRDQPFKARLEEITNKKVVFHDRLLNPVLCRVALLKYATSLTSKKFLGELNEVVFLERGHFYDLKRKLIIKFTHPLGPLTSPSRPPGRPPLKGKKKKPVTPKKKSTRVVQSNFVDPREELERLVAPPPPSPHLTRQRSKEQLSASTIEKIKKNDSPRSASPPHKKRLKWETATRDKLKRIISGSSSQYMEELDSIF